MRSAAAPSRPIPNASELHSSRTARSRSFTSAVYMVYPESRDEEAFEPILQGLRRAAKRMI